MFRVWDEFNSKMYYEGFTLNPDGYINLPSRNHDWPLRLLRDTERFDKNKNRIYEGDIILAYGEKWKVIYSQDGFVIKRGGHLRSLRTVYGEVIGNYFENPRLLIS